MGRISSEHFGQWRALSDNYPLRRLYDFTSESGVMASSNSRTHLTGCVTFLLASEYSVVESFKRG